MCFSGVSSGRFLLINNSAIFIPKSKFHDGNFQFSWAVSWEPVSDPLLTTGGEVGDMEGHARLGGGGSGGGGG